MSQNSENILFTPEQRKALLNRLSGNLQPEYRKRLMIGKKHCNFGRNWQN